MSILAVTLSLAMQDARGVTAKTGQNAPRPAPTPSSTPAPSRPLYELVERERGGTATSIQPARPQTMAAPPAPPASPRYPPAPPAPPAPPRAVNLPVPPAPAPPPISDNGKLTPRGTPQSWVTTDDYPAAARRAHMTGTISFELDVSAAGRPLACRTLVSSGHRLLDDTTCALAMRRGRFSPGRGPDGAPAGGRWTSRMQWKLPDKDVLYEPWMQTTVLTLGQENRVVGCTQIDMGRKGPIESVGCREAAGLTRQQIAWLRGDAGGLVTLRFVEIHDVAGRPRPSGFAMPAGAVVFRHTIGFDVGRDGEAGSCTVTERAGTSFANLVDYDCHPGLRYSAVRSATTRRATLSFAVLTDGAVPKGAAPTTVIVEVPPAVIAVPAPPAPPPPPPPPAAPWVPKGKEYARSSWTNAFRFTISPDGKLAECRAEAGLQDRIATICADIAKRDLVAMRGAATTPLTIQVRFDHVLEGMSAPVFVAVPKGFRDIVSRRASYRVSVNGRPEQCVMSRAKGGSFNEQPCADDFHYRRDPAAQRMATRFAILSDGDPQIEGLEAFLIDAVR